MATARKAKYRPKKALVTGGAGFIGNSLVRILLDEGIDTRVMVMRGDPATNLNDIRNEIEIVEGNLTQPSTLGRAVEGCDTLFHLAAIYATWLPKPRMMFDVNVTGTRNIMAAATEAGVKRIVHTSSIAAVGTNGDDTPSTEDTHFNSWDYTNDYVMSKYISELEVLRLCNDGLPAVVVNPAFPFGWGDVAPTPTGRIILGLLEGVPFYFLGGFNVVGVKDVAMGHWLAALHGKVGRRYILSGENMAYTEFAARAAKLAGVKEPRFKISTKMAVRMGQLGDFVADNFTHKEPLMAEKYVKYAVGRTIFFDNSRARTELGYDPKPADVALEEAIRWFRRKKNGSE